MKKNESKLTVLFVNAYQEFLTLPLKLFLGIRLQIPVKDVGSSIKAIEKRGVFSISITKRMLCFTSGQQKKNEVFTPAAEDVHLICPYITSAIYKN